MTARFLALLWDCRSVTSGPDAAREAAVDRSSPDDWREVLRSVLGEIDTRMHAFWD